MEQARIEWTPQKRAFAAQWLIEKRLGRIRAKLPAETFVQWAASLELVLRAIDEVYENPKNRS